MCLGSTTDQLVIIGNNAEVTVRLPRTSNTLHIIIQTMSFAIKTRQFVGGRKGRGGDWSVFGGERSKKEEADKVHTIYIDQLPLKRRNVMHIL